MTTHDRTVVSSPLGLLRLVASDHALLSVELPPHEPDPGPAHPPSHHPVLVLAVAELQAYFSGTAQRFQVPLELSGTDFQRAVWQALRDIPFGQVRTYGEVAAGLGMAAAARAVGMANARNPLAIMVPCHRVIGAGGKLTGYGGGLPAKQWLLRHERSHSAGAVVQQLDWVSAVL